MLHASATGGLPFSESDAALRICMPVCASNTRQTRRQAGRSDREQPGKHKHSRHCRSRSVHARYVRLLRSNFTHTSACHRRSGLVRLLVDQRCDPTLATTATTRWFTARTSLAAFICNRTPTSANDHSYVTVCLSAMCATCNVATRGPECIQTYLYV